MSTVGRICKDMAGKGYGHEDVFVMLKAHGLACDRDRAFIRRYVLGLSSYSRRYRT
jgi:hypothetical protein